MWWKAPWRCPTEQVVNIKTTGRPCSSHGVFVPLRDRHPCSKQSESDLVSTSSQYQYSTPQVPYSAIPQHNHATKHKEAIVIQEASNSTLAFHLNKSILLSQGRQKARSYNQKPWSLQLSTKKQKQSDPSIWKA